MSSVGKLVGQWIDVRDQTFVGRPNSDGGVGIVTHEHQDGSFDIRYSIDNRLEKNVARGRIKSYNSLVLTARWTLKGLLYERRRTALTRTVAHIAHLPSTSHHLNPPAASQK